MPAVTAQDLYEAVLDVKSFPSWAPGVRRVEIVEGLAGPGMVSEWEVSILGVRRSVLSTLKEAESPALLRWTYDGLVCGWGECVIKDGGGCTLAEFRTELRPTEPTLEKLMRMLPTKSTATSHLKRCLVRLGQTVSGNAKGVRVGTLKGLG
ncbi:MAG: SRPBCC family protein [Actinomycetota bacterium]|nr:SRPBCC family protein [Actinomycetota bacterium]